MDLESAIRAHGEWKIKFRSAIQKKEKLDADSISKDNVCPLGKWLYGEAKQQFGSLKSHAACIQKHAAFHREAGKVAATINAGKYEQAEAMLGGSTAYAVASNDVAAAIVLLRKESGD